jgi:hypothetical protein
MCTEMCEGGEGDKGDEESYEFFCCENELIIFNS